MTVWSYLQQHVPLLDLVAGEGMVDEFTQLYYVQKNQYITLSMGPLNGSTPKLQIQHQAMKNL